MLAEGVASEVAALGERLDQLVATLKTRRADIAEWTAERDRLEVDPRAERLADALAGLHPLRRRAEDAAEDLPKREEERDGIGREIARLLGEVGLAGEDPAGFGLTGSALDRLDRAVQALAMAEREMRNAGREHEDSERALARQRETTSGIGSAEGDADALAAVLEEFDAVRRAEALAEAREARDAAGEAACVALAALSIGGREFIAPGPVPLTPAGAEDLAESIASHAARLDVLNERLAEDDRDVSALAAEIAALRGQGEAPGDDEAAALREARDRLWAEHRTALSAETAEAYAAARAADDHAGALRLADTARLADLRRLERDLARASAARDARGRERERAEAALDGARARLAAALQEIGLPGGLGAAELAGWLRVHLDAVAAWTRAREAEDTLATAEARALPVAEALAAALGTEPVDLCRLVEAARARVDEAQAKRELRAAADRTLADAEAALAARRTALEAARDRLRAGEGSPFRRAVRLRLHAARGGAAGRGGSGAARAHGGAGEARRAG